MALIVSRKMKLEEIVNSIHHLVQKDVALREVKKTVTSALWSSVYSTDLLPTKTTVLVSALINM